MESSKIVTTLPSRHYSRTCCVEGCFNTNTNSPPDTQLYAFSTRSYKKLQRELWIKAVNRTNRDGTPWQPKASDRICSNHFIGNKKSEDQSSPSYVPTIFPSKDINIHWRYRKEAFERRRQNSAEEMMSMKCCVPHCNSNFLKDKIPFFCVPKTGTYGRKKWLDAIGVNPKDVPCRARVCKLHFDENEYCAFPTRTMLNRGVVPHCNLKNSTLIPVTRKVYGAKVEAAASSQNSPMIEAKAPELQLEKVIIKEESDESCADDKVIIREPVESSTDEAVPLEIPIEEVIIKDEPDDGPMDGLDVTQDPLPLHVEESVEINETVEDEQSHATATITSNVPLKPAVDSTNTTPNDSVALNAVQGRFKPKDNNTKLKELIRVFPLESADILDRRPSSSSTAVMPPIPTIPAPVAGNVFVLRTTRDGKSFLTSPIEKKNSLIMDVKNHLDDFTMADMKNPRLAAKFYSMACTRLGKIATNPGLLYENRVLQAKNAKLTNEVKCLKIKLLEYERQLKSTQPAVTADSADVGSLKRKADCEAASPCAAKIPHIKQEPGKEDTEPAKKDQKPVKEDQDPLEPQEQQQEQQQQQQQEEESECFVPRPESLKFEGQFRVVELPHFVNAIIAMQTKHSIGCSRSVMVIQSELLHGLTGNWTFVCRYCGHKATISTERKPSQTGMPRGMQSKWLSWLESVSKTTYSSAYRVFRQLNVPFYFSLTEGPMLNTVKTVICKRTFVTDTMSRLRLAPRSPHIQLTPRLIDVQFSPRSTTRLEEGPLR